MNNKLINKLKPTNSSVLTGVLLNKASHENQTLSSSGSISRPQGS